MKVRSPKTQSGFALLIFLVVLMGMGGLLITGFSQSVLKETQKSRYEHNRKVLEEAKRALLMYAYRNPDFNAQGPGRLPCPDTTNDGNTNATAFCKFVATGGIVGRLPWNDADLNFYEALDATGERLWYAVSENFANNPAQIINSDSVGTITIFDQTGSILYDGAANGVAAVIIAPGEALAGQNRNADPLDPANYLDAFGGFNNSVFFNGSNALANGFRMGPVRNNTTLVMNDQMVFITSAEMVAMAEKATLQAYRDAIDEYQNNVGVNRYPWLDPYDSNDGLGTFDATVSAAAPNPVIGRLPSIFSDYFTNNASQVIQSEMDLLLNVDGHPVSVRVPIGSVRFLGNGNLESSFNDGDTFTGYVWDGHPTNVPSLANDGIWEACPYVTGTEEDCNQDTAGNFIGGSVSDVWLQVRQVTFEFDGASPFEFSFGNLSATPVSYTPPSAVNHAYIYAEYNPGTAFIKNVEWSQDDNFKTSFLETPAGNNGTLTFDGGDSMVVGIRYYPTLPDWARTDGWHDKIQMAYSSAVQPGGDGACNAGVDDCLSVLNSGGITDDKLALLVLAGRDLGGGGNPWIDEGGLPEYFSDDLPDIFEGENNTSPQSGVLIDKLTFDRRPGNGNDIVYVLQQ